MTNEEIAALELRAMRSAWLALAARWELTPSERAGILPAGGEEAADPPQDTEARMRVLIEIGHRARPDDADLRDWLRRPAAVLGWLTPLDAMSGPMAGLRRLRQLVEAGFGS